MAKISKYIKVDKNILANLSAEFNVQLKRLESEIFALAGEEFNIGSPKLLLKDLKSILKEYY